ncbi:3-hydroxyacyl-CoA dehydrogenase family protein [Nocardia sp. NPDC046473]|uniref:3-hydroxyacyl-CoA dehydrogenase family protein n=1 Tax=Nocardia sp. NPDC046473 TaxID=3155733 RepID=UPI0033E1A7FE
MHDDDESRVVTIVGAGVMGTAIATTVLHQGVSVHLIDSDDKVIAQAPERVSRQLRHAQLMGAPSAAPAPGTLTTSNSVDPQVSLSRAVIEAIVEDADLKQKVLADVVELVEPGTPLISNTSGIPIDELAGRLVRPEDLVGTHFMNPAYLIDMVEVIRGPRTSESILAATTDLLMSFGRKPVVVRDSPGFVTSRLLHPMINEASRIVGDGIASAEDVDALMQGCLGHPTGPLRTADLIGIDNLVDALRALYERTGQSYFEPSTALLEKVQQGDLGRKTGRGFYEY